MVHADVGGSRIGFRSNNTLPELDSKPLTIHRTHTHARIDSKPSHSSVRPRRCDYL